MCFQLFISYTSNAVVYVVDREVLYEDIFAAVGDTVTIPCHGSRSTPVLWQYKKTEDLSVIYLYDRGRLIGDYVNKCTIDNSRYDLTIRSVEIDDAGEYWCVENEGFGVKHVTKLFVTGNVSTIFTQQ